MGLGARLRGRAVVRTLGGITRRQEVRAEAVLLEEMVHLMMTMDQMAVTVVMGQAMVAPTERQVQDEVEAVAQTSRGTESSSCSLA